MSQQRWNIRLGVGLALIAAITGGVAQAATFGEIVDEAFSITSTKTYELRSQLERHLESNEAMRIKVLNMLTSEELRQFQEQEQFRQELPMSPALAKKWELLQSLKQDARDLDSLRAQGLWGYAADALKLSAIVVLAKAVLVHGIRSQAISDGSLLVRKVPWFSKMARCVANMPSAARRISTLKTVLVTLGVNEAWTVGSYAVAFKFKGKPIKPLKLAVDMGVGGVASIIEPLVGLSSGSGLLRYLGLLEFNYAIKSPLDSALYYAMAPEGERGEELASEAVARGLFSDGWATGNSAVKAALFPFLVGVDCLYPGKLTLVLTAAIQMSHRAASSTGFFYTREVALGAMGFGSDLSVASPSDPLLVPVR